MDNVKSKPKKYWNKKRILKAAKKFKRRTDFRKLENGAYNAARRLGILDIACVHMQAIVKPVGYWSKERVLKEAKKFKTREAFNEKCTGGYQAAYRLKIHKEAFAHMTSKKIGHGYWTKSKVFELRSKYSSIMDFKRNNGGAYAFAYKSNFFSEFKRQFKVIRRSEDSWSKKEIFKIALKYKTRKEFYSNQKKAYRVAKKKGWIKEIYKSLKMGRTSKQYRGIYAYEFPDKSVYVGLTNNYKSRHQNHMKEGSRLRNLTDRLGHTYIQFNELYPPHLAAEMEHETIQRYILKGWKIINIAKAGGLGGYSSIWTMKKLLSTSKKFKTRSEFKSAYPGAYSSARKRGLLRRVTAHMEIRFHHSSYWSSSRLKNISRKYKTRSEFKNKSPAAYAACQRKGILDVICKNMKSIKKPNNFWTFERILLEAKKFSTRKEFKEKCPLAYQAAARKRYLKKLSASMDVWT